MRNDDEFLRLLSSISRSGSKDIGDDKPDEITSGALQDYEAERKKLENVSIQQNIAARKTYANRIFWLVSLWLGAMLTIVILAGFGQNGQWFYLADSVLIALVTTTTISVLGLFTVVINYLFRAR
jgi:hypothetical protein